MSGLAQALAKSAGDDPATLTPEQRAHWERIADRWRADMATLAATPAK